MQNRCGEGAVQVLWVIGCVALAVAGFGTAFLPRWRARRFTRKTAWSGTRTAIEVAAVSRDACATRVVEAEQLLARAESIAAEHGGRTAARTATGYAQRADALWRAATDD